MKKKLAAVAVTLAAVAGALSQVDWTKVQSFLLSFALP